MTTRQKPGGGWRDQASVADAVRQAHRYGMADRAPDPVVEERLRIALDRERLEAAAAKEAVGPFVERKLTVRQIERLLERGIKCELLPNGNARIPVAADDKVPA